MSSDKKIAVIGAGISGLVFAYRLQKIAKERKLSWQIHLFEKLGTAGGIIQTSHRNGFTFEKGPDGFIQQKTTVGDLARELGIEAQMISTKSQNRRSLILQNNQLIEVPDGFYLMAPSKIIPFLKSPLLSWKGKLRTLAEIFIPSKKNDDDESLADFVRRRFGKENLEKISQAMLGGIYTANPEHLSMQAAMPRFVTMEKTYGSILKGVMASMAKTDNISGPRYGLFATFRSGMSTLIEALVASLEHDTLHLDTAVQSVAFESTSKNWKIKTSSESYDFDAVCLTTAPYVAANILFDLTKDQRYSLQSIPYASSAILHFGFKKDQIKNRPSAIGFIVPHAEQKHLIACSFISNKYENRAPEDSDLIRVFAGGAMQEDLLQWPQEKLRTIIFQEIKEILRIEGEPVIEDFALWPKSMPQYTLGHAKRAIEAQKIMSQFPNLSLLGNGYRSVGIPDLIEQADQCASGFSIQDLR